ncbi:hypothetical protein SHJG_5420 [Streptomyces hygroscopicus subsp. jinggangensis 5008]|nr:hypothetical protein SHJG_5420 [Streptomyces hygroscopicus subsp. jinggangensis 5008]AGF64846.1 hypothetical protein SHJGH_5183 [Streptomyces hygroscopicus subsp. jinggangensis TL01]
MAVERPEVQRGFLHVWKPRSRPRRATRERRPVSSPRSPARAAETAVKPR